MTLAKILALCSLGTVIAGTVFTSVSTIIWPYRYPVWVARTSSALLLGSFILLAVAATVWLLRKG